MKRAVLLLLALLLLVLLPASTLLAQDYEVVRSTGDHGFLFSFRQSAAQAFAPPKDNELSTGIVSADGKAVMAEGPSFDFPNVGYGGEDDVSIRFKPVVRK